MKQSDTYIFDAVLSPHRSLKPEHFKTLILVLIVLCTIAGIRFTLVGAWPVAAFLWLDLVALWLAFFINYRRARVREFIRLSDTQLTVERTDIKGRTESWAFEPYWVKLELRQKNPRENELILRLHGQQVSIGTFLNAPERKSLFKALDKSLQDWKADVAN